MKTNNLKHRIVLNNSKINCEVVISLNDECKNGHQDFHITGTFWEIGEPRIDKYFYTAGSCHDEILKHFPEFKIFADLHGCDFSGVPTYAIENGFYHLTEGFNDKKTPHKVQYCNYYRVTPQQYDTLILCKEKEHFGFLLFDLGIVKSWNLQAKKAIKTLEKLTGNTFLNDSVKTQFNMDEAQLKEVEQKVKNGFYSLENIQERQQKAIDDKRSKLLTDLKQSFEAKQLEALQDYEIDRIGIELFLTTSNIIFYKHQNKIVFNWQDGSYNKQYNETEFKLFLDVAKENQYLKNCEFELKNNN